MFALLRISGDARPARRRGSDEIEGAGMAVQQNKVTRSRRNMRRAHDALDRREPKRVPRLRRTEASASRLPGLCGHYAGREVVAMTDEVDLDEDDAA
jgi:large subunit ribosomal protein L32